MNEKLKLGAVCFQEYTQGYLDFLELAAELELSWVEFKYENPLCSHQNSVNYRDIRNQAESLGIGLSMHTAFDGLNIASINKDKCVSSLIKVKESIVAASEMEISHATLHAGHLPSSDYTKDNWDNSKKINVESIYELVEFSSKYGLTLCLENGNPFNRKSLKHGLFPGDLKFIRKEVGDALKYTVDFGHALYFSQDPSYFVSELGIDHVKLSHLHSNSGLEDSHQALDCGILQLEKLVRRSLDEKWNFPVSLEMKSEKDLRHSIDIIRQLLKT